MKNSRSILITSFLATILSVAVDRGIAFNFQTAQPVLADTGQSIHYTQVFGEDSDYAGPALQFIDNHDGTVTDKNTGLMWQKQDGGEMTWENAKSFATKLNLGGHTDWRLPNSMELFSILSHARQRPPMDTSAFTPTNADYWWTSSPRADDTSKIWIVNAGGGIGAHPMSETVSAGGDRRIDVLCVRGNSPFGSGPKLKDNGDGTVTDLRTGLQWQKEGPVNPMTWEEGLTYCVRLSLGGKTDWRMPNVKELRSISDDDKTMPSADTKTFDKFQSALYWTSTTQVRQPNRAWFVDFRTGLVSYADKPEQHLVLSVRGGGVKEVSPRTKPKPDPNLFNQPGPGGKKRGGGGR